MYWPWICRKNVTEINDVLCDVNSDGSHSRGIIVEKGTVPGPNQIVLRDVVTKTITWQRVGWGYWRGWVSEPVWNTAYSLRFKGFWRRQYKLFYEFFTGRSCD